MQVNISEPCHENWQDFTPTHRGAFCQKCAIDVIDFSNKTADEVKQTLLENSGKNVCGRFKTNQLNDLSQDYKNWENQTSRTFQSKFLWACILVFGMTLFSSCNSTQAQDIINNTVKTELISDPTDPDSLKNSTPKQIHLLGKVAYTPAPVEDDYIKGDIDTNIECTANDSTKNNLETTDSTEIEIEPMLLGEIAPPEYFDSFLRDTVNIETPNTNKLHNDSTVEINKEPIQEIKNKIVGELYPNPTNNRSWLIFTPVETGLHEVILYSITGEKLFTAFSGKLKKEQQQRIGISLSEYETGIYIVKIIAKNSDCSLKMNKVR